MTIQFTVYGEPKTAGSKRAMPIYRQGPTGKQLVTRANGSPVIVVIDDNQKSRDWKNAVASAARDAYRGDVLRGALRVTLCFYRIRPKGHFGSGRNASVLKPGAPAHPTPKPDVLKLARAVEDALTGVCWLDDAQIVAEQLLKRYGEPARVEIVIEELSTVPATAAG